VPNTVTNEGWIYNVESDAWKKMSQVNAPSPREGHVAVWAGNKLVIWGGRDWDTYYNDGAVYDPTTDEWTPLPSQNVPAARWNARAAWTGKSILIFGGDFEPEYAVHKPVQAGGLLDFTNGRWTWLRSGRINLLAPKAQLNELSVWTGEQFIKWGGVGIGGTGAMFYPE
jgi:N-acetylneuraminic acid mutarotase